MSEPTRPPDLTVEMVSQPQYLAATRAMIGKVAQRIGFSDSECSQITLALDEALCNVIKHGYEKRPDGRIWISIWQLADDTPGLRIVVEDRALQVDPDTIRSRDLDEVRPGGLGVHIIHQTMDEVRYEKRQGAGMRLIMTKRLRAAGAASDAPQPAATGRQGKAAS